MRNVEYILIDTQFVPEDNDMCGRSKSFTNLDSVMKEISTLDILGVNALKNIETGDTIVLIFYKKPTKLARVVAREKIRPLDGGKPTKS